MRLAISALASLVLVAVLVSGVSAAEKTLEGTVCCPKCELKKEGATKCATVIVVKEEGKDILYYFDDAAHKKYHRDICTEAKEGKVTGVVAEKEGKKLITKVSKVEYDD